ncbi:MDR family MFS transporter [Streptomyces sp. NPDC087659]|uniref:MDR family MFS transporter n=1 Tax=Streptomyces sp. NPDC087659 TaxID=3365801 RepID=UPI00381E7A57
MPSEFWWLWTCSLMICLGSNIGSFLALYLTVVQNRSAVYAGLMVSLFGLGKSAGSIVGGICTDRVGRRATVTFALTSNAISTAALAIANDTWPIALSTFLVGMTGTAAGPPIMALIGDITSPELRSRAYSLLYWGWNMALGIAAPSAGLLATSGYGWIFFCDIAITLTCMAVLAIRLKSMDTYRAPHSDSRDQVTGKGGDSLASAVRNRRFISVLILALVLNMLLQQGWSTLPIHMEHQNFDASEYGIAIAVNGISIFLLQIPVSRWLEQANRATVLSIGMMLSGAGFGLTAYSDSLIFYAITVLIWSMGEILYAPAALAEVADLSPEHSHGRYQGLYTLSSSAAVFLGPLIGGVVLENYGSGALWGACAAIALLGTAGHRALKNPQTAALSSDPLA